jgi:thiol-disulfide isomerase/thioredoxin
MSQSAPIEFELYSSSFCGACRQTRSVLERVSRLVPNVVVNEHDVAHEPDLAERHDIQATPTVIVRAGSGAEVMRASGVPQIDQVLVAVARALDLAQPTDAGGVPGAESTAAPTSSELNGTE